jgi:hypothetical protein
MTDDNESVYAKLVENKSDILGIIAYSLYKRQKIEYLSNIKDVEGRNATQEELKSFLSLTNSPIQLEFYKDQAAELGGIFVDEMLSEHIESMDRDFSSRVHAELSGLKNNFWSGVAQSLVGSVLFILFVGTIVFFSWSLNQGVENAIESIFNIKIDHPITNTSP